MEDYIEIFLYILVTIIFIIVGSLGKKKKKNLYKSNENSMIPGEEINANNSQSMFDLLGDKISESFNDILEENIETPAKEEPEHKEETIETIENVEKQPVFEPMVTENIIEDSTQIDFDLRRAVIYSEILNRKSY